jgi:hypothetical protein
MSYTIAFDLPHRLVRAVIEGRDTLSDMQERFRAITRDSRWSPGLDVLLDFRGVTDFDLSASQAQHAAELFTAEGAVIGDGRVAIVADRDLVYGMGRMWQAFSEASSPTEVGIFRTLAEAESWLGLHAGRTAGDDD